MLPLGLIFLFPGLISFYGREYFSNKNIIDTQGVAPKSLFGFAYNDISFYSYKEMLVAKKNPQVLALGTSRVMQIREEFFTGDTLFVNAGGAGKTLEDMERFISNLPSTTNVQVIIIGFDKEILVSKHSPVQDIQENILPIRFGRTVITMSRRMYLDYISNKYSFEDLRLNSKNDSNIGISALLHGNGFRYDGSYRYGSAMVDQGRLLYVENQVVQSVANTISKNKSTTDDEIKNLDTNIIVVTRILTLAKEKKIIIIGVMPPYPKPIYEVMIGKDNSLQEVSSKLSKTFKDEKSIFFDLSSIDTFGGLETEFVDGIHGTDTMYLKMMIYIIKQTNVLNKYTNPLLLDQLLKKSNNDFLSF